MMTMRSVAAHIALVCASLCAALLVLEVSLRAFYPAPIRFFYPQEFYDFDSEMGYALRPRQNAFSHDRPVQTNSLGLRDREIAPYPTSETLRVLALGDSQTFGNGLDLSETWPKQLERILQNLGPRPRWEVVNAGIPGTDTWQHEIVLERLLDTLHPQAVVLGLYVNDVAPSYDPGKGHALELTNTWSKRFAYLLKRSSLVTWFYYHLVLPWQFSGLTHGRSIEDRVIAGEPDESTERGWRQVERSLAGMKDRCVARKVMFLVAILPRRDQVTGENPARGYNVRALAIAENHRIPMVDLLSDLSATYRLKGTTLFIPWDGHNGAAANQVIAARLAPILVSEMTKIGRS
jgi:lysophospholipase L1-like esterase